DRVGLAVGGPEYEKEPDPAFPSARRLPEILVEAVEDAPRVALVVRRPDGRAPRKEAVEYGLEDRAGIAEARKPLLEEQAAEIRAVLNERQSLLVAPHEVQALMPHQVERIDGEATGAQDRDAVAKYVAKVVVGRRAVRIDRQRAQEEMLPRDADHTAAVCGDRDEGSGHRERQPRVLELGTKVAGELAVPPVDREELARREAELRAEELREGRVHQRAGGFRVGQEERGVHRNQRAGIRLDVVAEPAHADDFHEAARPEAGFLRV